MDVGSYQFKSLESKYGGFLAPAFEITVGATKIDSSKIPVSQLSIDIDAGTSAGGCQFTIESQYDYETSKWAGGILDTIQAGAKLSVSGGYVKKEELFYGFVDDFSIDYSASSSPRIVVHGIDAKGYLMSAKDRKYMSEKATTAVVKDILNECVTHSFAKSITVGTLTNFNAQLIQEEIDDYKFLCFLAEMYNMCFFIINGEIIFDSLMSKTKPIIRLSLGTSLLNFSKTVSLKQQVGKVMVFGIDPKTKKPIKGEATDTSIGGAGKESGDYSGGFNKVIEKEVNLFVYTPEECTKLAQARFDARAFSFVKGKGKCIGMPELIPGRYVELAGFDEKSSDTYFITKVTHEYTPSEGYYTTFEVKGAKSK